MTTGRINQVTTFHERQVDAVKRPLQPSRSSLNGQLNLNMQYKIAFGFPTSYARTTSQDALFPRSHKLQAHFSLSLEQQRSWPSVRTTINRYYYTVKADSQMVSCDRFSYQQVIHFLHPLQALYKTVLDLKSDKMNANSLHARL